MEPNTSPAEISATSSVPSQAVSKARLIAFSDTKLYSCTCKDMYEAGSIEFENKDLRQIIYITAVNASEVYNELKRLYPEYNQFTIDIA